MKKALCVSLTILTIILLCGNIFAYRPIIGNIPNIRIGDMDDNAGSTIDRNFFRFSHAFNFDEYVSRHPEDTDFSTTNIRWSFYETDGAFIDINGKTRLVSPDDALNPGAKEFTNFPNNDPVPRETSWADFWDIQACPQKWLGTYPTPGILTDTILTFYASNGTEVDSKSILVKSVDGGFEPPPPPEPVDIITYPAPATYWTKSAPDDGTFINVANGPFYIAERVTSDGSIGISGSDVSDRNVFASWETPANVIPYIPNNVYRARFRIWTDQSDTSKVPKARLRFGNASHFCYGIQYISSGINAPTPTAKDYWAYYLPPDLTGASETHLVLYFGLVDFTNAQSGALWLDEVVVQRFQVPPKGSGTPVVSFNATQLASLWSLVNNVEGYGPLTAGTSATGLYLESPTAVQTGGDLWGLVDYAQWCYPPSNSPHSWVANKLYRATFTLEVPDGATQTTLARVRMMIVNKPYDWIATNQLYQSKTFHSHMPSTTGTEYGVFCHSPDILYDNSNNKIGFMFDLADGSNTEQGRVYLTKVEVEYYDIP